MSLEVVVSDAGGTRVLSEQDLPLGIGTGTDCDLRVPGPVAPGDIAQIGVLDGQAFVQVPGKGDVRVNGEAVTSTRWLQPQDELVVAGVGIACESTADKLAVQVDFRNVDYQTAPPELGDAQPASETIAPLRNRKPVAEAASASAPAKNYRVYAIGSALGLLLFAAAYMFSSVTVVITADQPDSQITLPGSWLTPGSDGRYLLWPGSYAVQIESPGFEPLNEVIQVTGGDRAEFAFVLKELPGRVRVTTLPEATGEVWLDGKAIGALPTAEVLLPRGKYELRVRTRRYLEYVATIEVEGRDQLQSLEAELVPGWADVSVTTDPPGAEVLLADELLGVTPATVEVLAGTRQLIVRKPGYRTEQRTLSVVAGKPEELPPIALTEAGGFLQISSQPSGSAVTVDNQFQGNTPLEIEVPKGKNVQVRVSRAGYKTATRSVQVADATPVPVTVQLKPKLGKINITATPADASLYVDGRLVGNASQELELLAVPHRLEIRKPGFETWTSQVTPKPGLPQQLQVRLFTPEQRAIASIPKTITTAQTQVLQLIQPGEFMLGAPRREQGRRPNEVRRSVRLTRLFYIAREEVSNLEYREFRPRHTSGAEKYRELSADNNPAVLISWQDAAAYCNWLSDRDGLPRAYIQKGSKLVLADPLTSGYRMPTEAEWAWVARYSGGREERKYPWGNGMPPPNNSGNFADMAAEDVAANTIGGFNDGYPVTSPGGAFAPNPLGIFDLGGNVAEWVNDYYSVSSGSSEMLIDPVGPSEGQYHVIRGSSWRQASISELRLAYRDFGDRGRLDVGFRLARYATDFAQEGE